MYAEEIKRRTLRESVTSVVKARKSKENLNIDGGILYA